MLFGVLLFALLGSVATHTLVAAPVAAHATAGAQRRRRDDAGAGAVAAARRCRAHAAGGRGAVRHRALPPAARCMREDGSLLFEREAPERPGAAPRWFAQLLPVTVQPGVAQVSDGWRPMGRLQLWSQADWAHGCLWTRLPAHGRLAGAARPGWRPASRRWRCAPGAGRWMPPSRRPRRWRSGASSSPTSRACRAAAADAQHELAGAPAAGGVRASGRTAGGAAPAGACRRRHRAAAPPPLRRAARTPRCVPRTTAAPGCCWCACASWRR